jgi:hypothetical protein
MESLLAVFTLSSLKALVQKVHKEPSGRFPEDKVCQAVSVHQNLQESKTDRYVFSDQHLYIVFDAYSLISLTGIDTIQHLSNICIHIMLLIFAIYQASRELLKVEVIHTTK